MMRIIFHITVFVTLLCASLYTSAQVTAGFFASDSTGCNSLIVNFTNTSTGNNNVTYFWNFGNGTNSTIKNPSVPYNEPGIYTVTLIVTDGISSDTLIKLNYIKVFTKPKADFESPDPLKGCNPLVVKFISTTQPGDGALKELIWDFGDGKYGQGDSLVHTFTVNKSYNITLFIEDSNLCRDSKTINHFIEVYTGSQVSFNAANNVGCVGQQDVQFTNTTSGPRPFQFTWNFGDGATSTEVNPVHHYSGYGIYNVKLSAVNTNGCNDSLIRNNFVLLQQLHADINIQNDWACRNQNLAIENKTTGANASKWLFGDGTTSTDFIPVKSYKTADDFTITYIASFNSVCFDTVYETVSIDRVKALFSTSNHYVCEIPGQIQYTDQSTHAIWWDWRLGGYFNSNQQNPFLEINNLLAFNNVNSVYFTDTLIVTSPLGCYDTLIIDSNVFLSVPTMYFFPNNTNNYYKFLQGCAPLIVNFSDSCSISNPDDPFVSKIWDFGDGTTSQELNPKHSFPLPGIYQTKLTATTQKGCINKYSAEVIVGIPQKSDFEMPGNSVQCGSSLVQFHDLSTDSLLVNSWLWDFGDGSQSLDKNPLHRFLKTGSMTVSLTSFYNGCAGSKKEVEDIITIKGPAGNFSHTMNCGNSLKYQFINTIQGADSIIWDFGDGFSDTTPTNTVVEHDYLHSGNYTVHILCINHETGCNLSISRVVFVKKIDAIYQTASPIVCANNPVWFNPYASTDYSPFNYNKKYGLFLWDFGDNTAKKIINDSISHVFDSAGIYNVSLVVKDIYGCADTMSQIIQVFKPEAKFDMNPTSGCAPLHVLFIDKTVSDTSIKEWNWDFGQGQLSNIPNPQYTFKKSGLLPIQLIATDLLTCRDTAIENLDVYEQPVPVFFATSTRICVGDTAFFRNQTASNGNSFKWDFGDGNQSNSFEPKHVYGQTGTYTVSLTVSNAYGCDSVLTFNNYISVNPFPVANFSANNTNIGCYPALINFRDSSQGNDIIKWNWDFGDQSEPDFSKDPWHSYQIPGFFTIKHTVENSWGCANTIEKNNFIHIGGPYAEIIAPDSACINSYIWIKKTNEQNLMSFSWLTDDGQFSTADSFKLYFSEFRKYFIYLSVESEETGSCDKIITDSISIPVLSANFMVSQNDGCQPLSINLVENSTQATYRNWFINETFLSDEDSITTILQDAGIDVIKLIATNSIGCADSTQKNITVYPLPPIDLPDNVVLCRGDSIRFQLSGGINYLWWPNSFITDTVQSHVSVFPPTELYYYVKVTDSNTCINSDSVLITVQQVPLSEIINNDTVSIIIGETALLEAKQQLADLYYWYPETFIDCISCLSVTVNPLNSMYYYFIAKDANHCFDISDSVFVQVDAKFSVNLPNAFTPNADGKNDIVYIKGWGIRQLIDFRVFTQTGQMVYSSTNIEEGWNGIFEHSYLTSGAYFYTVTVEYLNNKRETKNGYIYIIN